MAVTTNRALALPAFNDSGGASGWGNNSTFSLNSNATIIDQLFGTIQSVSTAGGSVALTASQAQNGVIRLTGQISASTITITFPAISAYYIIDNQATTPAATDRCVILSTGSGSVISTPRGSRMLVNTDGSTGSVSFSSDGYWNSGDFKDFGGTATSLPTWITNCTVQPWLICDGSAVDRTTYAQLFSVLSTTWGVGNGTTTFNLPDLRFRGRVPLDNMGGSAAGRSTGGLFSSGNATTVGSVGGEASHTQLTAELAAHTHSVADPGHTHAITTFSQSPSGGSRDVASSATPAGTDANTKSSTTGITIGSAGSGTAFNVMQPFAVSGLTLIKS